MTAIRTGLFSTRVRGRAIVATGALALVTAALAVIAIGTGEFPLSPTAVIDTLLGGGPPGAEFIVNELRLPRVTAALVSAAPRSASPARSSRRSPATRSARPTSSASRPAA